MDRYRDKIDGLKQGFKDVAYGFNGNDSFFSITKTEACYTIVAMMPADITSKMEKYKNIVLKIEPSLHFFLIVLFVFVYFVLKLFFCFF